MGLRTPATKVWEIPEPTPAIMPTPEAVPEAEPAKAPEKERELEPAGRPFWRRGP